jgi:hypothetical protein
MHTVTISRSQYTDVSIYVLGVACSFLVAISQFRICSLLEVYDARLEILCETNRTDYTRPIRCFRTTSRPDSPGSLISLPLDSVPDSYVRIYNAAFLLD